MTASIAPGHQGGRASRAPTDRLAWLGLSLLLAAFPAVATVGRGAPDRAFYAWAALYAGLFVRYWQFSHRTDDGSERRTGAE